MRVFRICCMLIGILLSANVQAQQSEDYLYQDTALTQPATEDEVEPSSDVVTAPQEEHDSFVDTGLIINGNVLVQDSIAKLKRLSTYEYATYLDSLLLAEKMRAEKKEENVRYDVRPDAPSFLDSLFASSITSTILWILAGLLIAYIVFKLFFTGGMFQRGTKKINVALLQEEADATEQLSGIEGLLANAIAAKNFKLATRYLYLQLIQKLSEAGAITYTVNKTNTDYLRELTGKPYKPEVAALTYHYEYVWYGDFAITEARFGQLQTRFNLLNKQI